MSDDHSTIPASRLSPEDMLGPGDPLMVAGFDWSWAFVVFHEIPGLWGYYAGTNGTIWSRRIKGNRREYVPDPGWKKLSPGRNAGYMYIHVRRYGDKYRTYPVHRLVLDTFRGPEPHLQACHHDRDKSNNRLRNLRYGTKAENEADKIHHGTIARGERQGLSKLTDDQVAEIRRLFDARVNRLRIAKMFNISRRHVYQIARRRNWAHVP